MLLLEQRMDPIHHTFSRSATPHLRQRGI